jgi:hypothetical protein
MIARYGPSIIEADSPAAAKRKFGRGCFTDGERAFCMTATLIETEEEFPEEQD